MKRLPLLSSLASGATLLGLALCANAATPKMSAAPAEGKMMSTPTTKMAAGSKMASTKTVTHAKHKARHHKKTAKKMAMHKKHGKMHKMVAKTRVKAAKA